MYVVSGCSKSDILVTFCTMMIKYENRIVFYNCPPFIFLPLQVHSLGPSDIEEVKLTIDWPSQLQDGAHLFYLTEEPKVIYGQGHCQADLVNPQQLQVFSITAYLMF